MPAISDFFKETLSGYLASHPYTEPSDFFTPFTAWTGKGEVLDSATRPLYTPVNLLIDFSASVLELFKLGAQTIFDLLQGKTENLEEYGHYALKALTMLFIAPIAMIAHTLYELAAFVCRAVATPVQGAISFFSSQPAGEAQQRDDTPIDETKAQSPLSASGTQ